MKAEKEQGQLKLTLSEKQYIQLMELVFLGKWMMNSSYENEPERNPYNELEQSLFNLSQHFNLPDHFEHYETHSFFTQKWEDEMMKAVDAYDEESFWMKLASLLAQRDLHREVEAGKSLPAEVMEQVVERELQYEQEFAKNGLRNVEVKIT